MRSANTRPSASAARFTPSIRLIASLAWPPLPGWPTRWRLGTSACSTGSMRATASSLPATSPRPSPFTNCWLVPETGTSTNAMRSTGRRAARAAIASGSQVLMQATDSGGRSRSAPMSREAASPPGPSSTSSTCAVLNTATTQPSHCAAMSATERARWSAGRPSRSAAAGSTSYPNTRKPAVVSRAAAAEPISPSPITPIVLPASMLSWMRCMSVSTAAAAWLGSADYRRCR